MKAEAPRAGEFVALFSFQAFRRAMMLVGCSKPLEAI